MVDLEKRFSKIREAALIYYRFVGLLLKD